MNEKGCWEQREKVEWKVQPENREWSIVECESKESGVRNYSENVERVKRDHREKVE